MTGISHETLMRYLDGEVPPEERVRIEAALAESTALQRDVAGFGSIKKDLQSMAFSLEHDGSVWSVVHRRLTRPLGWFLVMAGFSVWVAYGSYLYMMSAIDPWEKLATSTIGIMLLFGSVIYERYQEWLTDPYRDVVRCVNVRSHFHVLGVGPGARTQRARADPGGSPERVPQTHGVNLT